MFVGVEDTAGVGDGVFGGSRGDGGFTTKYTNPELATITTITTNTAAILAIADFETKEFSAMPSPAKRHIIIIAW